ncbi:MAG: DUF4350 domain-containing protein [Candidatus Eremiobacteraeota bacterium]|nr:DUF4350 domain-containing protein [Candidatus Eremiobacteraeota bacterium]
MLKRFKMNKEATLVIILITAFITVIAYQLYEQYKIESPGFKLPANSESARGDGFLALYRMMKVSGFKPGRWKRSAYVLPPTKFVLLVANPMYPPYGRDEARVLLEWVERGNILFLIGNPGNAVCKQIGIEIDYIKKDKPASSGKAKKQDNSSKGHCSSDVYSGFGESSSVLAGDLHDVKPSIISGATVNVNAVTFQNRQLITRIPRSAIPVFGGSGNFNVILLPLKKGKIIVSAEASPFINRNIDKADNAQFILQALRVWGDSDRILFDEYHHGLRARDSILAVMQKTPVGWGILQVILSIMLILFGFGYRFGKPREERSPDRGHRSRSEYVVSMANLFRKRNETPTILKELVSGFREDLSAALGLQPNTNLRIAISRGINEGLIAEEPAGELMKILEEKSLGRKISEKELMNVTGLMEKIISPIRRRRIT